MRRRAAATCWTRLSGRLVELGELLPPGGGWFWLGPDFEEAHEPHQGITLETDICKDCLAASTKLG